MCLAWHAWVIVSQLHKTGPKSSSPSAPSHSQRSWPFAPRHTLPCLSAAQGWPQNHHLLPGKSPITPCCLSFWYCRCTSFLCPSCTRPAARSSASPRHGQDHHLIPGMANLIASFLLVPVLLACIVRLSDCAEIRGCIMCMSLCVAAAQGRPQSRSHVLITFSEACCSQISHAFAVLHFKPSVVLCLFDSSGAPLPCFLPATRYPSSVSVLTL